MAIPISSCCLLASPHVDPIHWQTAFYTGELTDDIPDEQKAAVAKEFIELQVDREGIDIGETDTDVLLITVHPGHVNRCAGIDFAGVMKLNQSREMRRVLFGALDGPRTALSRIGGLGLLPGRRANSAGLLRPRRHRPPRGVDPHLRRSDMPYRCGHAQSTG
jgi:hypothetical protein